MIKKYLNQGAEEFLSSLKPGTFPKIEEDTFLNYLIKDAEKYFEDKHKLVYSDYTKSVLKFGTSYLKFFLILH
jgi:hypothetical protein